MMKDLGTIWQGAAERRALKHDERRAIEPEAAIAEVRSFVA